MTTIFTTQSKNLLGTGHTPGEAFTSGYQRGFWALLALSIAGAVASFVLLRGVRAEDVREEEAAGIAV